MALGAHFNACDVHRVLGLCDRADGLLGQAETRLTQARELAKMTGSRMTEAEAARDLGRLYAETGRVKEAYTTLHEAAQGFERLGATAEANATQREIEKVGLPSAERLERSSAGGHSSASGSWFEQLIEDAQRISLVGSPQRAPPRPTVIGYPLALHHPHSSRSLVLTAMLTASAGAMACREGSPVQGERPPAQRFSAVGGPGDSLAKLHRRLLTDSNPRPIMQAIVCENVRLGRLYGEAKADAIASEVRDMTYRSTDEAAMRRVDALIANSAFDLSCGYLPGPNPHAPTVDSGR